MGAHHQLAMSGLLVFVSCLTITPLPALAAEADGSLYDDGAYVTILGRYLKTDSAARIDNGKGITIGAGLRRDLIAFEARAGYTSFDSGHGLYGSGNILVFPFAGLPGLYGLAGVSVENIDGYPGTGGRTFNSTNFDTGVGYIFPLSWGAYRFGLRAEALYEYAKRNKREQDQPPPTIDLPVPSSFDNVVLHIGLQLPFGSSAPTPARAPETPVTVVPTIPEPPPTPPPSPPTCKQPQPGERVSLSGCGIGDVIVLHGVSFDFDKSSLTVNAKTILDNVADELKMYPDVRFELDGYTDSLGSYDYNQRLSEQRAASVASYLSEHGVDAGRMTSKGFGESMPVAENDTDDGHEQNRRVELKIVGSAATTADAGISTPAEASSPVDAGAPAAGDAHEAPLAEGTTHSPADAPSN